MFYHSILPSNYTPQLTAHQSKHQLTAVYLFSDNINESINHPAQSIYNAVLCINCAVLSINCAAVSIGDDYKTPPPPPFERVHSF